MPAPVRRHRQWEVNCEDLGAVGQLVASTATVARPRSLAIQQAASYVELQVSPGERTARCPKCGVAVWSNYAIAGPLIHFVRVGTLDDPDLLPPDIHIFTASKQPWVVLPEGVPAVSEYYDRRSYWSEESLARHRLLLPLIKAYEAAKKGDA